MIQNEAIQKVRAKMSEEAVWNCIHRPLIAMVLGVDKDVTIPNSLVYDDKNSEIVSEALRIIKTVDEDMISVFCMQHIYETYYKRGVEAEPLFDLRTAVKQCCAMEGSVMLFIGLNDRPIQIPVCTPVETLFYSRCIKVEDPAIGKDYFYTIADLCDKSIRTLKDCERELIRQAYAMQHYERQRQMQGMVQPTYIEYIQNNQLVSKQHTVLDMPAECPPYEFMKLYDCLPTEYVNNSDNSFEAVNAFILEGMDVHEDVANYMKTIEDFLGVEYEVVLDTPVVAVESSETLNITEDMKLKITKDYLNEHLQEFPKKVVTGKFAYNLGTPSLPISALNILTDLTKKDKAVVCKNVLQSMDLPAVVQTSQLLESIGADLQTEYTIPTSTETKELEETVAKLSMDLDAMESKMKVLTMEAKQRITYILELQNKVTELSAKLETQSKAVLEVESNQKIYEAEDAYCEAGIMMLQEARKDFNIDGSTENRTKYIPLQAVFLRLMFADDSYKKSIMEQLDREESKAVPKVSAIIKKVRSILER